MIDEVAAATEKLSPPGERSGLRSIFDNNSLESATRRSRFAASSTSGEAQSPSTAIRASHATPSTRSCSRPCPARGRSRLPRCRGALASTSCSSSTAWRTCPPAFTSCCETPRAGSARSGDGPDFVWTRPAGCPALAAALPLGGRRRAGTPSRRAAVRKSRPTASLPRRCSPSTARPSRRSGPGSTAACTGRPASIGQVLYLEAEASGIRGTGIGCFFDDLTHQVFGLAGRPLPGALPLHHGRAGRRSTPADPSTVSAPRA